MADTVAAVLTIAVTITSALFCLSYHLVAKWWNHPFGVSLMIYQILMTAVMALSVPRYLFGYAPEWVSVVRTVVYAIIPLTLVWRTVVMIKVQRREGRHYDD
jgi:hypothetical protein